MNFHVVFNAGDLVGLKYTGSTSPVIGRQYMNHSGLDQPSFYAKPGEMREIADHFAALAEEAGE